jgi:predicted dehydrogenase
MKQLLQAISTGESFVADVPAPSLRPGCVLVRVGASAVSVGTERAAIEFTEKSLLSKARARPDLVRQVLDKTRREGILTTWDTVRGRLDRPLALGYSAAGTVVARADDVGNFTVGDRVACAGGGYASHAEIICVPKNLAVPIPPESDVPFEQACFTTVVAIALHGIRLSEAKLGDTVGVIGLGMVGQLTLQLLKAMSCRVIGLDLNPDRAALGMRFGAAATSTSAEEFIQLCRNYSPVAGADAILIAADAANNEPVRVAGEACRDKGTVVAIGAVGTSLPRKIYYEKEIDFRISRSYGPGRYDAEYEDQGKDYPVGYVRWTERRNMQAALQFMAEGKLQLAPLITHRFPIAEAHRAYALITGKTQDSYMGVVIQYPENPEVNCTMPRRTITIRHSSVDETPRIPFEVKIGVLGAGNFSNAVLLPALKRTGQVQMVGICASGGVSAFHGAKKFGFAYCTTDEAEILENPRVNTVVIATRHHLHARQTVKALRSGKHIFVEKPLAICLNELAALEEAVETSPGCMLMVGFNRRFAPLAVKMKSFFAGIQEPLVLQYRCNAGYLPPTHWAQDHSQGGGRVVGEACHFIDFASWFIGESPVNIQTLGLPNQGRFCDDNVVIALSYPGGSVATVTYIANGDRAFGKERVEVHAGGRSAVLDDFRKLEFVHNGRHYRERTWLQQDKGHYAEISAFVKSLRAAAKSPIPFSEILTTTRACFAAVQSLSERKTISLNG